VFSSDCQPGKENHAEVARGQITQTEGAAGKILLGEFFESDQEGREQARMAPMISTSSRLAGKIEREKSFTHNIATGCDHFYDEIATAR